MKATLLVLSISMLGLSAFAHEGGNFGRIVCVQNTEFSPIKGEKITVQMDQIGQTRMYNLVVTQKQLSGERRVILQDVMKVTTEDVMANFRAKGSKTSVMIYLDELNQSNISIAGLGDTTLICRTNR